MTDVKRYDKLCCSQACYGGMAELPDGGYVAAADHDRIVSCMTAGREAVERENKGLRAQVRELEQTALTLRAEVERLQGELAVAHSDASYYASTSEDLRAEVEDLRTDAERINWLAAQARMIYGRKDEASYQLSDLPELIKSSREECQPDDLRRAIDAAMEASRCS